MIANFFGTDGKFIPRAGRQTIITAVDAVAHFGAQAFVYRPFMLNGEIRNTASRVQLIGCWKRIGWTSGKAGAARSTVVNFGGVHGQVQCGEHRADEKPVAQIAADQIGVLALPAQTRGLPQRLFWHWRGVYKYLHFAPALGNQPARQTFQTFFYRVVIIAILRIDRDCSGLGLF